MGTTKTAPGVAEPYSLPARSAVMDVPDPIGDALTEPRDILAHELDLIFRAFTADTAFALGTHLRNRLHAVSPRPVTIQITSAASMPRPTPAAALAISSTTGASMADAVDGAGMPQFLFVAHSRPGAPPDHAAQCLAKRAAVLRYGHSSWYLGRRHLRSTAASLTASALTSSAATTPAPGAGASLSARRAVDGFALKSASFLPLRHRPERTHDTPDHDAALEATLPPSLRGGAVPIRIEGVEGVVAVVAVTGLDGEDGADDIHDPEDESLATGAQDHQVVVEGLEDCIQEMRRASNGF